MGCICSYVEQATKADDLPTICACLLAMGVWPVGYLRMLVGYGVWPVGRTDGRSDKRELYALHGILRARSGSPQLLYQCMQECLFTMMQHQDSLD